MRVTATTEAPRDTGADTVLVGLMEGEGVAHDVDGALQGLVDAGEARPRFKHLAVAHAAGLRWLLVGLGRRDELDAERARVAAAAAVPRAREIGARTLCWELPHHVHDTVAGALVEGTVLAAYRDTRFKTAAEDDDGRLEELLVSAHHDVSGAVTRAATVAEETNAARDLQNAPANHLTPSDLARHADAIATAHGLDAEILGPGEIRDLGMGAFSAVAQGSEQEPRLIVLRRGARGGARPQLALVGKAVTFDSGGISIKPAAKMHEMKFDMSGGAAVLHATAAIARLGLPVDLLTIVGATENLPSGRAVKPGDVVTAMNGTTIEVNNTDAEGRLVLADCLAHAAALGAERIVDVATLTGAIVMALGSTHAGLMSNDDAWAERIEEAGRASGDLVWRLPLHAEYADLIKGQTADIVNAVANRKAGSITAAEFLRRFVGDTPWAHVDIAGTAWDVGRPYTGKAGSGFGVRLLVELAERLAG